MKKFSNIIRSSARVRTLTGLLLLIAALGSPAAAASATLYAKGVFATPEPTNGGVLNIITQPGGGIYHGTHFWLADGLSAFVRLQPDDVDPNQITQVYAGYASSGSYAQVAYDAAHDALYVADQGSKGVGIVRLSFAPNELVSNACFVAPSFNGRRPSAVALGPDGNLYVGFLTTGDIVRLPVAAMLAPPGCQVPPVVTIGKSIKGGRVNGLAFVGSDLYIAGKDGLTKIPNATSCLSGCTSQVVPGFGERRTFRDLGRRLRYGLLPQRRERDALSGQHRRPRGFREFRHVCQTAPSPVSCLLEASRTCSRRTSTAICGSATTPVTAWEMRPAACGSFKRDSRLCGSLDAASSHIQTVGAGCRLGTCPLGFCIPKHYSCFQS